LFNKLVEVWGWEVLLANVPKGVILDFLKSKYWNKGLGRYCRHCGERFVPGNKAQRVCDTCRSVSTYLGFFKCGRIDKVTCLKKINKVFEEKYKEVIA